MQFVHWVQRGGSETQWSSTQGWHAILKIPYEGSEDCLLITAVRYNRLAAANTTGWIAEHSVKEQQQQQQQSLFEPMSCILQTEIE